MFNSIAVICTGNICRSPIAEVLLRTRVAGRGIRVISAGTHALIGAPADPLSRAVMADRGHDLSKHRAQQASDILLCTVDLILTLDESHNDWIARTLPQLSSRTHKLGRWRGNLDVADPYGMPRTAFERAYEDIEAGIEDWLTRIG